MTQNEGGKVVQFPGQAPATEPEQGGEVQEKLEEIVTGKPADTAEPAAPKDPAEPEKDPWVPKKGCFKYRKPEDVMKDAHLLRVAFLENGAACIGMECHNAGLDHVVIINATRDQFYARPVIQLVPPTYDELLAVEKDQLLNYKISAKSIVAIHPLSKFEAGKYLFNGYLQMVAEMWSKRLTEDKLVREAEVAEQKRNVAIEQQRQQVLGQLRALPLPVQKEQLAASLRHWDEAMVRLNSMPAAKTQSEEDQRKVVREQIEREIRDLNAIMNDVMAKLQNAAAPKADEEHDVPTPDTKDSAPDTVETAAPTPAEPEVPAPPAEAPAPGGEVEPN